MDIVENQVYVWLPKDFRSAFEGRVVTINQESGCAWVRPVRISLEDWQTWQRLVGREPLKIPLSCCIRHSVFF